MQSNAPATSSRRDVVTGDKWWRDSRWSVCWHHTPWWCRGTSRCKSTHTG